MSELVSFKRITRKRSQQPLQRFGKPATWSCAGHRRSIVLFGRRTNCEFRQGAPARKGTPPTASALQRSCQLLKVLETRSADADDVKKMILSGPRWRALLATQSPHLGCEAVQTSSALGRKRINDAGYLEKRLALRNAIGCAVRFASTRSARISPTTGANLNPWPLKPAA